MEVEARHAIVQEALSWQGTPWMHMQRCRGAGVDCVGLIGAVGVALGYLTPQQVRDVPYYTPYQHLYRAGTLLVDALRGLGFVEAPKNPVQLGDIVTFRYGRAIAHAGIAVGNNRLIHAPMGQRVCISLLQGEMQQRLSAVFSYPGLGDAPL